MRVGNKKIYHLEAWVVKVMSLYKVSFPQHSCCDWRVDSEKQQFVLGIELGDFDDLI
jgi:hypothetical protein